MRRSCHLLACLTCVPAIACSENPAPAGTDSPPVPTIRRRELMTTYVTVTVSAAESPEVLAAIDAAFAEIERVDQLLNEWKEGTEISAVNRQAGKKPVAVSQELFEVVERAREVSVASAGAFDITVGALWGAWDFTWQKPKIPSQAELARRVALIDYRQVELDRQRRTIRLAREGMSLVLGGIAKGYAIDRASAVLTGRGYRDHLVVAGGDLFASGRKDGHRWRIGIRHPGRPEMFGTIEVENEGIATSGNYERFFFKDGVRYHHLLDPRTGMPARGLASATVRAPNATLADAYATAVFVSGPDRGLALAKGRDGIEAFLFAEDSFERTGTAYFMTRVTPLETGQHLHHAGPWIDLETP